MCLGESMWDAWVVLTEPYSVDLALGGAAGVLAGVLWLIWRGRRSAQTEDGDLVPSVWVLLSFAFATIAERPLRIGLLLIVFLALYAVSTVVYLLGSDMGQSLLDFLFGGALVYAAHRLFLLNAARDSGVAAGRGNYLGVLVRLFLFSLIMAAVLVVPGVIAVLAGIVVELAVPDLPYLYAVPAAIGSGLAVLASVYLARASLVFPSASVGGNFWWTEAMTRSRGLGWSLAGALWIVALIGVALFAAMLELGWHVYQAIAPEDAVASYNDGWFPVPFSTDFWHQLVLLESAFPLVYVPYAVMSIAVVSGGFQACIIEPARRRNAAAAKAPASS